MAQKTSFSDNAFWVIVLIFLLTIHLSTAVSLGRLSLNYVILTARLPHLLGTLGVSFIAIYTPLFYVLKRKQPQKTKNLLKLHVFGNSIAFMFVTLHLVSNLFILPLGIGVLSYLFMLILVASGFSYRFGILRPFQKVVKDIPHYNRYIHISMTLSFYLVIIFHLIIVTNFQ